MAQTVVFSPVAGDKIWGPNAPINILLHLISSRLISSHLTSSRLISPRFSNGPKSTLNDDLHQDYNCAVPVVPFQSLRRLFSGFMPAQLLRYCYPIIEYYMGPGRRPANQAT